MQSQSISASLYVRHSETVLGQVEAAELATHPRSFVAPEQRRRNKVANESGRNEKL